MKNFIRILPVVSLVLFSFQTGPSINLNAEKETSILALESSSNPNNSGSEGNSEILKQRQRLQ